MKCLIKGKAGTVRYNKKNSWIRGELNMRPLIEFIKTRKLQYGENYERSMRSEINRKTE